MTDQQIILAVVFTTLALLLLVAGIAITFFISVRQKLEQQMKMKQVALEYQQELRTAESEVAEAVRAHLSREIHDNIGHLLTYLRLQLENKLLDYNHLEPELQPLVKTTEAISQQLRMLSRTLNPEYIKDQTLDSILKQEADRIQQLKKIQVHWNRLEQWVMPSKEQQLFIFRIYQEILHNVLKHSQAKNLFIEVGGARGTCLRVRDDGRGFDFDTSMEGANGLKNILRRAELSGLDCKINTAPGKGCEVVLSLKPPTENQLN